MKGRWKSGKTHSTIGTYHNHFCRRLAVVFHVKLLDVQFRLFIEFIENRLFIEFIDESQLL
jgi:hypothetical protein